MKYNNIQDFLNDLEDRMDEIDAYQSRKSDRSAIANSSSIRSDSYKDDRRRYRR